jgi:hypothetical protein
MERFLIKENIARFRALLETERDPHQRTAILSLPEEQKLAELEITLRDKSARD